MNKKILAGAVLIVAVAAVVAFFTIQALSGPHTKINQKVALSRSPSTAIPYGPHSILLSGPDDFTTYDYTTGKNSVLGAADVGKGGLANVDTVSISPDKKFILFHDTLAPDGGILANQLLAAGELPGDDFWWIYNVRDNTFRNLPADTTNAKLHGDTVYALEFGNGTFLNAYTAGTLQQTKSLTIMAGVTDFLIADGGYLLQTYTDKVYFTKDNVVHDQLFGSGELVSIAADGKTAIAIQTSNKVRSLVRVDISNNDAETTLADGIMDTPAVSSDGNLVLYNTSLNGSFAMYNMATKETRKLAFGTKALPKQADPKAASIKPAVVLDANTFIGTDQNGAYNILGDNLYGVKN